VRHTIAVVATVAVAVLSYAAAAEAAGTYTLCSSGAHQPVVSPGSSGKCAVGQKPIRLATAAALGSLQHQVSALKAKLAGVSRVGHTLGLVGMNLQLENGRGSTGVDNGLGNLIIGYNEGAGQQTGSHNLVVGNHQTFTAWGGIIGGDYNNLAAPLSVLFGSHNEVAGAFDAVTGGEYNLATDEFASVAGGCENLAGLGATPAGHCSLLGLESVTGGEENTAAGNASSVSGGLLNTVSGGNSSILGGIDRQLSLKCATFPDSGQSCP
jgi:hypothetical protein